MLHLKDKNHLLADPDFAKINDIDEKKCSFSPCVQLEPRATKSCEGEASFLKNYIKLNIFLFKLNVKLCCILI
jgi:hypothetical protein